MTLIHAAVTLPRRLCPTALASLVFLTVLLLVSPSARAQSQWQPNWTPCDKNGNPLNAGRVDPEGFELMGGTLTGSASGSQSAPYRQILFGADPFNLFLPTPSSTSASSGKLTLDDVPLGDDPVSGILVGADNAVVYDDNGIGTSLSSNVSGQSQVSLQAYFLWQPGYYTDDPPPGPPPPPPATATFLLRTRLTAWYDNSYWLWPGTSDPNSAAGMASAAFAQDDVFGEKAQAIAPPPPYALTGGGAYHSGLVSTAGGLHLVTSSLQMVGGKGIYEVTLSGNTSASASDSMNGVYYYGSTGAEADLNGSAKHDDRAVILHRDGAHNETVDADGTVHGDTTYSYIAGNTIINNAQSFYPTFSGTWSPNPQYIANGTGPLINISWKWALPGENPQFVDTWNSHGLNTDIGSLRSVGPDSVGNAQWTGTPDSVKHINVLYTATDLKDQATAAANYDLRVHDQYDNWRRVDSHGSPMDALAAGDIGGLNQIGQNTAQRMDVPTVSVQEAGVDWNAVGIVGGGVFSGTSLLIAGIGASSLDPPIWPVTIIGLVGLGIQTVSSLPPPPPPAPVAPPDQINASFLQTAYQNYVYNQTAYPGEENDTNLVDTNLAKYLDKNPDFSGFDSGNYGTVSITATVYAKMLNYYFYADQYDRGGLVTTTASSTLHRPGGHVWRYLWSYAGSVPLPTNPK